MLSIVLSLFYLKVFPSALLQNSEGYKRCCIKRNFEKQMTKH